MAGLEGVFEPTGRFRQGGRPEVGGHALHGMGDAPGCRGILPIQGRGHLVGGIGLGVGEAGEQAVVELFVACRAP